MDALREGLANSLVSKREGHVEQGPDHDTSEGKPAKGPATRLAKGKQSVTPVKGLRHVPTEPVAIEGLQYSNPPSGRFRTYPSRESEHVCMWSNRLRRISHWTREELRRLRYHRAISSQKRIQRLLRSKHYRR